MDLDYWRAKLRAWAFHEPQAIHTEATEYRNGLFAVTVTPPRQEDWLARVAAIHQKLQRAGLISTGAVN